MNKASSQYLQEVKKRIPRSVSLRAEFLRQLEAEVIYYCEDHENVDYTTLLECFGKPEDIAKDFLAELGGYAAIELTSAKRRILFIITLIAMIVVICAGVHTWYLQLKLLDVQYVESITYEGDISSYATSPDLWTETFGSNE